MYSATVLLNPYFKIVVDACMYVYILKYKSYQKQIDPQFYNVAHYENSSKA